MFFPFDKYLRTDKLATLFFCQAKCPQSKGSSFSNLNMSQFNQTEHCQSFLSDCGGHNPFTV